MNIEAPLALPFSKCAHLLWPYDLDRPADRETLAAVERAAWSIHCGRVVLKASAANGPKKDA